MMSCRANRTVLARVAWAWSGAMPVYAMAQPAITSTGLPAGAINFSARCLSGDGKSVAGDGGFSGVGQRAHLWTNGSGFLDLGLPSGATASYGRGISSNGAAICGELLTAQFGSVQRAYRWTSSTGIQDIGVLPGGATDSIAYALSADGNVVVGESGGAFFFPRAFRWTQSDGMVSLGALPGMISSTAWATNADGSVVVGTSAEDGNSRPFRWTFGAGMVEMQLPANAMGGTARALSVDGLMATGWRSEVGATKAARWAADGTFQDLGGLVDAGSTLAMATSADGNLIVGQSDVPSKGGWRAFVWSTDLGMLDLQDYLAALGTDLTGWSALTFAVGVSADGSAIAGEGSYQGKSQGFLVTGLPMANCYPDCDVSGVLSIDDFICFQTSFAIGDPYADCDVDGTLSIDDFICFQTYFAIGC